MTSHKLPLSALPLPTALVTKYLTPDPHTPSLSAFRNVQQTKPSIQRRARLLNAEAHYSHVSPFVIPFPYDIPGPEDDEPVPDDKGAYIEKWLSDREALQERQGNHALRLNYPELRDSTRQLIGLSETGLRDAVPHLDVGDAFATIGEPSLSRYSDPETKGEESSSTQALPRQELVDVLSGYAVLASPKDAPEEGSKFGPFSYRYSGKQFGDWAGQLGDGRAISVLITQHPSRPDTSFELQLKGAGRTPFSRSADGLAVVRSSIREYLCSEAMHALGIPTTRSLALVNLPDVSVVRERQETACVLTRMAESFIRIGSFEAFNPPAQMFFFGGGQQKANYDGLRILGEWVSRHVLKISTPDSDEAWGEKLVLEVATRNAKMVAGWQAYGFMHGVINTDNVSIMGLTIDYGPYAFMDKFDKNHICNHTDAGGRYSYKLQPSMILFAVRSLLSALAPLIGKETELGGKAVSKGWADDAKDDQIDEWAKEGLKLEDEVSRVVQEVSSVEYGKLMRRRLGLLSEEKTDEVTFFRPLLDLMEEYELDFHGTFRTLCRFSPKVFAEEVNRDDFIRKVLSGSAIADKLDQSKAKPDLEKWLAKYSERLQSEEGEWGDSVSPAENRQEYMRRANPRFVLRQWLLQETIEKVENDPETGKRFLAKVMHMASNPYEAWGGEEQDDEVDLDEEQKEERRFCGLGAKTMLGFQCSCSS